MALDDAQEEALREELKKVRDEAAKGRLKRHELEAEIADRNAKLEKAGELSVELEKHKTESKAALEALNAEHTAKLAESKAALDALKAENDGKLAELTNQTKEQVKAAKLEALAIKEGLVDVDGLKLLDLSKIVQKDDGTFEGVEDVFKAAKESKPYLFGEKPTHSSPPGKPPKPGDPKPLDARALSAEEYVREKAKLLG